MPLKRSTNQWCSFPLQHIHDSTHANVRCLHVLHQTMLQNYTTAIFRIIFIFFDKCKEKSCKNQISDQPCNWDDSPVDMFPNGFCYSKIRNTAFWKSILKIMQYINWFRIKISKDREFHSDTQVSSLWCYMSPKIHCSGIMQTDIPKWSQSSYK